jgi:glycosyltransferase involved in cell wall biosynthesis
VTFSLIVVTTDRLSLVERLFNSLANQVYRDFEVILVHGPAVPEAAARAVAENFAALNLKILTSRDHCLSRSRNLALPQATGDILAFPDDDCLYAPDTLARCAATFEREPHADVILGRTLDLAEDAPTDADNHRMLTSRYSLFRHSTSFVQFHRKQVAPAIGGFDENMGVGCASPYQSGEDTDYVLRAFSAGFGVFHAPSVLIRHPAVNPRDPALPAKVKNYAAGRMYLLRKHGLPLWFKQEFPNNCVFIHITMYNNI